MVLELYEKKYSLLEEFVAIWLDFPCNGSEESRFLLRREYGPFSLKDVEETENRLSSDWRNKDYWEKIRGLEKEGITIPRLSIRDMPIKGYEPIEHYPSVIERRCERKEIFIEYNPEPNRSNNP